MDTTINNTPVVCGHCRTINYRKTQLTCKRCGQYFSFKREPLNLRKKFGRDTLVTAAVMSGVAVVCGTAAATFTFLLVSVM
jgi:uncharacterized paraquat-inducible protein A